jgi:hypothetical protein
LENVARDQNEWNQQLAIRDHDADQVNHFSQLARDDE